MEILKDLEAVFGSSEMAYSQSAIDQISKHRRIFENKLFFDRLLHAIGISQASEVYPPKSIQEFRELFELINNNSAPDQHKLSLIYYVFKDLSHPALRADVFARNSYLPRKYQIFVDGIWCLDRGEFEAALDSLTEPCLVPTFPEDVLYTLCRHSKNPTLALAYYHTVAPSISSSKVLDTFFNTICYSSITDAFFFARNHGELSHQHLFEQLVAFVHGGSGGDARAARAIELIGLPLDASETAWLEEYLLDGKGKALYGAKDTVMVRKIATGKAHEAAAFGKNLASFRKIDGLNWEVLSQSLQTGAKGMRA